MWDMIEVVDLVTAQFSIPEISRTASRANEPSTKLSKGCGTRCVLQSPPDTASSPREALQGGSLSFGTSECLKQLEFTQKTNNNTGNMPETTDRDTRMGRRRCPSRDPTRPHKPTTARPPEVGAPERKHAIAP
jgi:hypothetical protein